MPTKLVREEGLAHISVVLLVTLADQLKPLISQYSVTFEDIVALAHLLWPKQEFDLSFNSLLVTRVSSALIRQHPWVNDISLVNLNDHTFSQWLINQMTGHGSWIQVLEAKE